MSFPSLQLATGDLLPSVGLGSWKLPRPVAAEIVVEAIRAGYRHFDCACDYGNEAEIGEGIQAATKQGLCRREELWVTSKLWNTYHAKQHVKLAVERSLRDLRLDYLDLYLMHFPISLKFVPFDVRYPPEWFYDPQAKQPRLEPASVPISETWAALEELVAAGLVRNLGVCHFGVSLLRDLLSYARIRPAVLQTELHPLLTQDKLLRFCRESGIATIAFSPLGAESYIPIGMAQPEESVLNQPAIRAATKRHAKSPAQIVLRFGVQRGYSVVPKTQRIERLAENLALFDFELSSGEMQAIATLSRGRRFNDPGAFCEQAFNTFYPIYE